jgi:L-malate glycosyltransferase
LSRRVLLTNFHPRGGGGHATYIQSLLRLGQDGHFRIAVAAPEPSEIYKRLRDLDYADLYECDFPAKPQKEPADIIRSISRFRTIVADFKPDIVHANGGADLAIALWSHPFRKYRVIRTHHGIKNLNDDFYHRYIYSRSIAQNIYVSSSAMAAAQEDGLAPKNCIVIPNGVDLDKYQPDPAKQRLLKRQLGLSEDALVFGSCAGVANYKRVDLMIAADVRVTSSRPFVILVIGDKDDGLRLQRMAEQAGSARFKYCGFYRDVKEFISLLDVGFVLSDAVETISFAAREMMAMGKPLIVSSYGGLGENIIDGQNGILVRPGNVNDVVAGMERFLGMSQEKLTRFSANARSYAEKNFDVKPQIQCHSFVYNDVLNGGR